VLCALLRTWRCASPAYGSVGGPRQFAVLRSRKLEEFGWRADYGLMTLTATGKKRRAEAEAKAEEFVAFLARQSGDVGALHLQIASAFHAQKVADGWSDDYGMLVTVAAGARRRQAIELAAMRSVAARFASPVLRIPHPEPVFRLCKYCSSPRCMGFSHCAALGLDSELERRAGGPGRGRGLSSGRGAESQMS
jgi:hypothetical protein